MEKEEVIKKILNKEINGEDILLNSSPVFKIRYTWDGDIYLGCKIGCKFCYYRWIDTSYRYIGTGKLKSLCSPHQMVDFLYNSKLFNKNSILILGARSDASMYMKDVLKFLEIFDGQNLVLCLHRAQATDYIFEAMKDDRFRFGTTITPEAKERGWSPILEENQIKGICDLIKRGANPKNISVQVGPLTDDTIQSGIDILKRLNDGGLSCAIVRGVSFGSFGLDKNPLRENMEKENFISHASLNEKGHEYYEIKNFLSEGVYEKIINSVQNMKIHRRTYSLYEEEWGVKVAKNRGNEIRIQSLPKMSSEEVWRILKFYGFNSRIEVKENHYFATLEANIFATEDIACSVGALLDAALIFNNYHRTTQIEDLKFYVKNNLLDILPFIDPEVLKAIGL